MGKAVTSAIENSRFRWKSRKAALALFDQALDPNDAEALPGDAFTHMGFHVFGSAADVRRDRIFRVRTPSTDAVNAANRIVGERLEMSPSRAARGDLMKYLLLLIPCVIALWVPLFNSVGPELFGIPFFYWFQLLLVPVSAIAIFAADRVGKA